MSRQFSSHQEHYPARGGGTLGADRKAATALVYQDVVAGVASTVAIQGDDGSIIAIQASALNTDDVVFNAALTYVSALGGGLTYFEVGNYNTSDPIDFPGNNLALVGTGRGSFINGDLLANNENAIEITGRTDCTLRNFSVQTNDGGDLTIHCIFIEDGSDRFLLENITIVNSDTDGIHIEGTTLNGGYISRCRILAADLHGIRIALDVGNTGNGIIVENNSIQATANEGIEYSGADSFTNCIITNNIVTDLVGAGRGIFVINWLGGLIEDNTIARATIAGIQLNTSVDVIINGNEANENVQQGIILLTNCNNNIISNNIFNENDSGNTGTYDGITINASDDNIIFANICNDNDNYGINIANVACDNNWVKNNQLQGNTTAPFNDAGTGTKLAIYPMFFIQGTTFISADGSAKGWEINAEADMAVALGQLPLETQQVVRLKIWAVALGAPAGAGGQMHLDILFNAGGSLEAWNLAANSWALANFDGEEADYVNTNVIHWVVEDGDVGTELLNLLGGDSLELKVNGGTAVAPDGATNATYRVVEIEYV